MAQFDKLLSLAQGFMHSQVLYVVAKNNFADLLKDGPKSGEEIARLAKTNEDITTRVLRAAAGLGILDRDPSSLLYSLNGLSSLLLDGPTSLRWAVLHLAEKPTVDAWSQLDQTVHDGSFAFKEVYGVNSFEYYEKHFESSDRFNKAMSSITLSIPIPQELNSHYDLSNVKHIVDIGGNQGSLVISLLQLQPHLRATIFDLPHVISEPKKNFTKKELESRINFVGGSFFESTPSDGDLYILKFIIHDWEDSKSIQILTTVRNSMPTNAKLVLVEHIVQETGSLRPSIMDLHMLVLNNAKERTEKEFADLFSRSGLRLTRTIPLPGVGFYAIEAEKVETK